MAVCNKKIVNLKMDFENLISCIECHKEDKNVEVIIETLKTVVNICAEEKMAKDAFRDVGGLDFLLQFLINTDDVLILEYCLKVLAIAVDGNFHNQMHLTTENTFKILKTIIVKKTYPLSITKNAVIFLSTLVFRNKVAQDLICENECLLSVINLYKTYIPTTNGNTSQDPDYLEIWIRAKSCLCFAVNNPVNDKNQVLCSDLFPLTLRIIETSSNPVIIEASSSFLSMTIANNEKNQNAFAEFDGFLILKRSLNKTFEQIQLYLKECNNVIAKQTLLISNSLISIISPSVLDHEKNAELCGKIGIVSLMINLLSIEVLNPCLVKKLILTLGHCVGACGRNSMFLLDTSNFDLLLRKHLDTDDQELHLAARYLLQVCLNECDTNQDFSKEAELTENNPLFYREHSNKRENTENNSMAVFRNRGGNMVHENSKSNLNKPLKQLQNLPSYEENFGSSSESNCSLQSAGHFHSYQMRRKTIKVQNSSSKACKIVDKSDNCCASSEKCDLRISSEVNYSDRKTSQESEKNGQILSEKHYSVGDNCKQNNTKTSSSLCGKVSKKLKVKRNVENKKEEDKSKPSNGSVNFPMTNHFKIPTNGEFTRGKKFKGKSNEHDNLESDEVNVDKENSHTEISNLPKSATLGRKTSILNANIRATDTKDKPASIGKLSKEHFSFELESFPGPYSFNKKKDRCVNNAESSCSATTSSNIPGCMEIIVLPGVSCCEHNLASQFEQLKVCPISNT